jgi:hypothetical protein
MHGFDPEKNVTTGRSANRDHKKFLQQVMSSPDYHRGAMTRQAHVHGYPSALPFAKHVLEHPHEYDTTTKRRAQFLANIQRK